MASMTIKQKREIIVQALKSSNARIAAIGDDANPQAVAVKIKNKGYSMALEDVLLLLDGNAVHIKASI